MAKNSFIVLVPDHSNGVARLDVVRRQPRSWNLPDLEHGQDAANKDVELLFAERLPEAVPLPQAERNDPFVRLKLFRRGIDEPVRIEDLRLYKVILVSIL